MQAKQYLEVDDDDDDDDEDETLKMADPALGGRYDAEQLRNMAWAAKLCVHASPHQRPQMSEVLLSTTTTLSSSATVLALHQSLVCMAGGIMYHAMQHVQVVQILAGEGAHLRGGRGAHGVDDELLPETDGYDGDAAPGYVDDLSRHKALAFAVDVDVDSDEDSTPPVRHAPATTFVREV